MNLLVVEESEITVSGTVILEDERAKHILKVLQLDVGDTLRAGILNGSMGSATILHCRKKFPFRVEVLLQCDVPPPAKGPVDLVVALPRPIMLRRVISQGTSLGVSTIHFINANRVEKSFWGAGSLGAENVKEHVRHGLEQAVDTQPPDVTFHRHFRPFIEDRVPLIRHQYDFLLLAHPSASPSLAVHFADQEKMGKTLVAIGPEGGWVDFEVDKFLRAGFSLFSMGSHILRVDTAVINVHGRLMSFYETRCRR